MDFFITLAQSVEVNKEVINHVLIACAAADARHELKNIQLSGKRIVSASGGDYCRTNGV